MPRSLVSGLLVSLLLASAGSGCGSAPPPPAEAPAVPKPKAPKSVSSANPGGDAIDPEKAALERLANEPWGFRRDHWNTLRVPLVDWKNWKRVRIWGNPTRVTYRYGDDHRAVDATLYTPIKGANDPDTCMARFMEHASTTAEAYSVHLGDSQLVRMTQQVGDETRPLLVRLLEGGVDSIVASDEYVGAIAVYQSWPGTCLVRGFAVVATRHHDLAVKVRDRWVSEGAQGLLWERRVKERPPTESR